MVFRRCCFCLALLLMPAWAGATKLRVCIDSESRVPYITPGGGGTGGLLVRMAAAEIGVEVAFTALPLARCREAIRANLYDAYPGAPYLPEVLPFFEYPMNKQGDDDTRAVFVARTSVFRRSGSAARWDGKRFDHTHGAVLTRFGSVLVVERLRQLGVQVDDNGKTVESNFRKLIAGRADLFIGSEFDGKQAMELPEFMGRIELQAKPFSDAPYYLAVNKQFSASNPGVAEQLWNAIGRIKHSSQYLSAIKPLLN
jgi:polar amino acid transport system substrate-binding protein